jgi:hypothetical protein
MKEPASATTMMTGVDPSAVRICSMRNDRAPVLAAAHRATVWSIRTTPEFVRIMYTTTPMPTPAITTASSATVSADPVAVAGSNRERMNRRSPLQRINWSSTAAVAERGDLPAATSERRSRRDPDAGPDDQEEQDNGHGVRLNGPRRRR